MFDAGLPLAGLVAGASARVRAAWEASDRARKHMLNEVIDCDRDCLYALEGHANVTAWLQHHTGMNRVDASRLAAAARRLARAPLTTEAMNDGRLSAAEAEALTSVLGNPRARDRFRACEQALVDAAVANDDGVDELGRFAKQCEAMFDPDGKGPDPEHNLSRAFMSEEANGRWKINADLNAADGALFHAELQAIIGQIRRDGTIETDTLPKGPALRGAALVELAARASGSDRRNPAAPTIGILVPLDTINHHHNDGDHDGEGDVLPGLVNGTPIPRDTLDRLLCDCAVHRLVIGPDGAVLDMGREERTATREQRLFLAARDGGCTFPECHGKPIDCRAHHIWHWTNGGPTDINNLALVCDRHHALIHNNTWQIELLEDDETRWTHQPTGRVRVRRRHDHWPRPPRPPGPPRAKAAAVDPPQYANI